MIRFLSFFLLVTIIHNNQNVGVTINIPEGVNKNDITAISGVISNGSTKNISFWDIGLFESLYRGDSNWNIIIHKEGRELFMPKVVFGKRTPPKVIRLKKNEKYSFQIPISFENLSFDEFLAQNDIESGYYDIQLTIVLKNPGNTVIESNKVKCYINAEN